MLLQVRNVGERDPFFHILGIGQPPPSHHSHFVPSHLIPHLFAHVPIIGPVAGRVHIPVFNSVGESVPIFAFLLVPFLLPVSLTLTVEIVDVPIIIITVLLWCSFRGCNGRRGRRGGVPRDCRRCPGLCAFNGGRRGGTVPVTHLPTFILLHFCRAKVCALGISGRRAPWWHSGWALRWWPAPPFLLRALEQPTEKKVNDLGRIIIMRPSDE